ncbi:MAG: transglutaminase-like domain-containing protein [Candidatus Zixiibacteriota bacterium]
MSFSRRYSPSRVLLSLMTLILIGGCAGQPRDELTAAVNSSLKAAGQNRAELETVLEHYEQAGDSLKLQAARYLIANMEDHCYVTYYLHDSTDRKIDFDVLAFDNYGALRDSFALLEKEYGTLEFDRCDKIMDVETITAQFLIANIDNAFEVWREKLWAQNLSFADFCEYVLPYRGSNESLEPWRPYFREKYAGLEERMTNPADPIEATRLINDDIKSWFKFDERYYYHPTDQGLKEMLEHKLGRCEDMTNLTIYALRANGLAVTSDYTPYWANTGNNHAWNAILTLDGRVVPFMGAESNPGDYHLEHIMAKTYRKTFSQQRDNLIFQKRKQEKIPGWLAGQSYLDVTAEYVDICDVTVEFTEIIPDSVDIAYLCVFNSGEWKPIQWGRIKKNAALFSGMGRGIAYIPGLYLNEKIVPVGPPFILDENCGIKSCRTDSTEKISLKLLATTRRTLDRSTDNIEKASFTPKKEYELFYWGEGDWQTAGIKTASDEALIFDDVPADALYWLVAKDSDREERIFTYREGQQVWW